MTDSQSVLLQLLSKSLFGVSIQIEKANWREVLYEAEMQAVTQLAYDAIDVDLLSSVDASEWKKRASINLSHNVRIIHNHELLHEWLTQAGIPYVILKGCSSGFYYPTPVDRSMGDVDFLVPAGELERGGKIFESKGLKPWEEKHISHIVFRKKGIHLEMHFNLAGTPEGKAGDLVREYMFDVYEKANPQFLGDGQAMLPSAFHHGLIILLHTCHHMTGEGIGLRHLCDWAVFENSFSDHAFCELFEEKLKKIGLWSFAQVLTGVSIKYLGAEKKAWAKYDEHIIDALMEDILTGGNFGKKDTSRSLQTMLISDRGKNGVGKNHMSDQFVQSTNKMINHHWPKTKHNVLLLPIGWFYFGIRRVIRELTGKRRKTDIKALIEKASNRRDIYSQLHLFEEET